MCLWICYLFCHFSHRLHTGSIQMIVVLSGFNKFVILNVFFHLFSRCDKVVVSSINFIIPLWSSCVYTSETLPWSETLSFFYLNWIKNLKYSRRGNLKPSVRISSSHQKQKWKCTGESSPEVRISLSHTWNLIPNTELQTFLNYGFTSTSRRQRKHNSNQVGLDETRSGIAVIGNILTTYWVNMLWVWNMHIM